MSILDSVIAFSTMRKLLYISILSSLILACQYPDEETIFSEHGVLPDGTPWHDPMLEPDYFDDDWFNKDVGALNPIDTNGLARSLNLDLIDIFDYKLTGKFNLDLFKNYDIKETGYFYRGSMENGWVRQLKAYNQQGVLTDTIHVDVQGLVIECFLYARDAFGDTLRSDTLLFKSPLIDFKTGHARSVDDSSAFVDLALNIRFFVRDSLSVYLKYRAVDSTQSPYASYPCNLDSAGRFTCHIERLEPVTRYGYYAYLKYRSLVFETDEKYFETDTLLYD